MSTPFQCSVLLRLSSFKTRPFSFSTTKSTRNPFFKKLTETSLSFQRKHQLLQYVACKCALTPSFYFILNIRHVLDLPGKKEWKVVLFAPRYNWTVVRQSGACTPRIATGCCSESPLPTSFAYLSIFPSNFYHQICSHKHT